jgi:hypothetical protein
LTRVGPPRVFGIATPASKPPPEAAGSADAYRQTGFVLGSDVELVVRGLNLEGTVADASSGPRYRTQQTAAVMGLWSRSWLARLGALHATQWGNYASALALVRSATDAQAGALCLLQTDASEWQEWLADGGVGLASDVHATEFRLHAFRAAEVLAAHAVLGPIYHGATDLSLPHFGATLVIAGSDSDRERVAITFGDRDFHVGLAELVLGWLALLSAAQVEDVAAFPAAFASPDHDGAATLRRQARALVDAQGRCRLTSIDRGGEQRYIIENWRRMPGSAARRLLL